MPGFNGKIGELFKRLDDSCVFHEGGSSFLIEEKKQEGEAKINVSSKYDCFHVREKKNGFPILRNKKFADYLVLLHDQENNKWILHIFELTKSIGEEDWVKKIVPQFDGALLNAYAICGVMEIPEFDRITVHCAYRRDKNQSSPVRLKNFLGKPAKAPWTYGNTISLPSFPGMKISKDLIKLNKQDGKGPDTELA